ncbi:MAG: aldose 1-epimerase [Deltaproteobacteria bacterium]|jgi:aldose 1-epimerase|nr:aldose 1-epimerase [Deltaproteobacteria bacterium]
MASMLNENEVKEKILNLRSGNTLLAIMPEVGGCITRYCLKNEEQVLELMRPATQAGLSVKDPLEMGCFPLIPFSNRIKNGRFSFQGKQIKMPPNFPPEIHTIHGQGWKAAWTVREVEENRAVIAYQHFPDEWPFPYLARQMFELNGPSLTVTLQITNSGKTAMPAGMGLHPYFVRTPLAAITAKTEKMRVNDSENMPLRLQSVQESEYLSQGLIVNQKALDNIFSGWNREVLISWPEWKAALKISAEAPLDFMVIFTPQDEDYFCVEPVSHVTDAFNLLDRGDSGTGAKILLPDEILEAKISFVPELN